MSTETTGFTVTGYIHSDQATLPFYFSSLVNGGQFSKERICYSGSKFFPFRVDFCLDGLHCPGKQTGSRKSCVPSEMAEQKGDEPCPLES